MLNILSLGAGVQSTTLLLMAIEGHLIQEYGHTGGRLDAAIFADTGWEPEPVYRHLAWLETRMQAAGIPLYKVSAGNLREDAINPARRYASMPLNIINDDGKDGRTRRQCTREYKVEPIERKVRELIGLQPKQRGPKYPVVCQWIGISLDEVQRMKDSRKPYIQHIWPLVDLRMTRNSCLAWLKRHDYPTPPKSACIGCPYHNNAMWRQMRDEDPTSFADAVDFDNGLRDGRIRLGKEGMRGQGFLHRKMIPLSMVDMSTPEDHGQISMFGEECEGMCGV